MASTSSRSVKVTDLNPHLLCVLCGGYYVDATTIIECLHSFCKSCIVRYLETNKYCPICDVQVHKSKPLLNIRSDRKLQAIVYKLVPGLFQRELNCRKEFYKTQPESKLCGSDDVAAAVENSPVYPPGETLLFGVQYADSAPHQDRTKRYLRCPAAITVSHLQKLMRAKFDLNASQRVEFLHEGDLLPDNIPLMDLAYMYHWKRKHPIELEYRLLECQQKKIKLSQEDEEKPVCVREKQKIVDCTDKEELVANSPSNQPDREVQLQISENGIMSVQSVDSSSNNTVVSSKSDCTNPLPDTSMPVKDIQLETIELVKSLGNDVTLNFDSSSAKANINNEVKCNNEIPNNNNTIKSEGVSAVDIKAENFFKGDTIKHFVFRDMKNTSSDIKNTSSDTKNTSTDVKNISTNVKNTPAEVKNISAEVKNKSTEVKTAPAEVKSTPAEMENAPAEVKSIPAEVKSAPTEVKSTLAEVKNTLAGVKNTSAEVKDETVDLKENTKDSFKVSTINLDKNKSYINNSALSITPIPSISSTPSGTSVHAQKVYPGAVKDGSNHLRHFKAKEMLSGSKKPEVTLKLTTDKQEAPKSTSTARYKTLKAPIKPWNPTIPRSAIMAMKQAQAANREKNYPGKTPPKAPKFFKMRNVPRFLGNPASGVKPMYQVLPGSELTSQASHPSVSQASKPMSTSELTVMKIDPKTLNPIPVSHSRPSKLNSSSSKVSTTFAPSHKPERDLINCGTPIRNPVSKNSSMSSRVSSQVHPPNFPSNSFGLPPPHIIYPGFPRPFSQVDTSGSQLPADSQILRAMSMLCSSGAAFHPSLPPSISMLLNPHHPHHRSTNEKLNFKYSTSDFHKTTTTTTPSVQRIPPSGPSSRVASPASNIMCSTSDSLCSPPLIKEHEKHLAEEENDNAVVEPRRSASVTPTNVTKTKSATSSSNAHGDPLQIRVGKISPLPITNGLAIVSKGNLDREFLKLNNQNVSAKRSVRESTEQSNKEENQNVDSTKVSESNCC